MIAVKDSTVICMHALQSVLWYRFYKLKNRLSSLRVGFFVAFSPVVCYNKKDTMQTIFPQPLQLGGDFLEIINQLATEFHLRKEQVQNTIDVSSGWIRMDDISDFFKLFSTCKRTSAELY